MRDVIGVDFSSRPAPRKPIVAARLVRQDDDHALVGIERFITRETFAFWIQQQEHHVIGIDAPFGFASRFLSDVDWPKSWSEYMENVASYSEQEYVTILEAYRKRQPDGQKEHRRICDERCGSISPQKLYGVPVAKMLYAMAPILVCRDHDVWPMRMANVERVLVEAYPGLLVRRLVGRTSYKDGKTAVDRSQRRQVRERVLDIVSSGKGDGDSVQHANAGRLAEAGLREVVVPDDMRSTILDDAKGDVLDALLCAMQVARAESVIAQKPNLPDAARLEGWIFDPAAYFAGE
ncbi:MAG: DUF429 domain-containing protein [Phycisphaerae bacterium]